MPLAPFFPYQDSESRFHKLQVRESTCFKSDASSDTGTSSGEGNGAEDNCSSRSMTFSNLAPSNPDIYYGAGPSSANALSVEILGLASFPTTQHHFPILPHFFLTVKGPDGIQSMAERHACYDSALGARVMYKLRPIRADHIRIGCEGLHYHFAVSRRGAESIHQLPCSYGSLSWQW